MAACLTGLALMAHRSVQIFGFTLFLCAAAPGATSIAIQPLGQFDTALLSFIIPYISAEYDSPQIVLLPPVPLPKSAYYKPGNRYRAELLLAFLDSTVDRKYTKVLGLTSVDISTTKGEIQDWGIFGLGDIGGRPCVVSVYRLRRNCDKQRFLGRLRKVVVHELGHTFGLYHCDWPKCVITDYKGTAASLDNTWFHFCSSCSSYLRRTLSAAKEEP
jgi:archaemetzincin